MGAIWLVGMADVLRSAGLTVTEEPGWQTRSRSSGGYDDVRAIGVHHDAWPASASEQSRTNYECHGADAKPIGACHVRRDGSWHVQAAGATNTQGKGGPVSTSKGTIPLDTGNRYMLSIEASNDGVGQLWPTTQTDAYVRGVAALAVWLGLKASDVIAHFEYTSRKIDPAGNSKYATAGNKWNMNAFRADVAAAMTPRPPTPPPPKESEIDMVVLKYGGSKYRLITGDRLVGISADFAAALVAAGIPGPVGIGTEDYNNLAAALVAE